jgi:hypothetical protein
MKKHIISYLLSDNEWWCGLNITNYGFALTTVSIEYHSDTGSVIKKDIISLNAGCQTRFLVDITYGWAIAISEDDVMISEFIGDSKSSMFVPIERVDYKGV